MLRIAGVLTILVGLYVALFLNDPNAMGKSNLVDVANRQGFSGIITLGVALLIITGAIDLSMGSVIGLSAISFGMLMREGVHPFLALSAVLIGGALIGLLHGLLVTRLKLQSFLVTLCGMFVYRGITRYLTRYSVGLGGVQEAKPDAAGPIETLRYFLIGKDDGVLEFPAMMLLLLLLATVLGMVLHKSVLGRYWYAIGYNESAARYAGIATDQKRVIGFILCSTLASLAGALYLLDVGSADPAGAGKDLELYAITGAVLGGCSLKGGEGTAIGIVLGAAVLPLLGNLISFAGIPDRIIPAVIGITLLIGTIADEFFRRRTSVGKK